jgi:hypothetical protein
MNVRVRYTVDENSSMQAATFLTALNPPRPMPTRVVRRFYEFELTESMPLYEEAKKILIEIYNMSNERDELIDRLVRGVLGHCATLSQVLKLWPTALDFMPDGVKQRHAEKTEKRKATVTADLVVNDDVKVLLAKARMLNN